MTKGIGGKFSLRGPCADCPFRNDRPFFLTPERVDEIADSLHADLGFSCHKTNAFDEDDGQAVVTENSRECGGVMAMLERMDRPSQVMRIGERLGMYDRHRIDSDAPVYDSIDEWRDAKNG
jgi:hypothetical protein